MLTLAAIIIAAVAVHLLWPLIVRLLAGALGLAVLAVATRVLLMIEPRLSESSWHGAVFVGAVAGLVVILLGYTWIHNALVDADLARQIERDRQQAKARKI